MKRVLLLFLSSLTPMVVAIALLMPAGTEAVELDGLIEPHLIVKIGSPVPGVIEGIPVDRGDIVQKGDVVATLQSGVETATMELARARAEMDAAIKVKQDELEFSKRREQRMKGLYSQEVLPFQEWDEAETKRALAEHELAEALENKRLAELEYQRALEVVQRMTIRSPVRGVVVERYLSPGEYVEDQPILEIAEIDPLNVEVILPKEMLGSVRVGTAARVKPEAPVNGVYTARVTIVDRVIDAASSTFGVRLQLPNPGYRLPPGLKCKVIFPLTQGKASRGNSR
jgi:RND family efflux transporter MFP subunit